MPVARKPGMPLKLYLLDARQSGRPLEGARLDLVEKFANTYEHARYDPSVSTSNFGHGSNDRVAGNKTVNQSCM